MMTLGPLQWGAGNGGNPAWAGIAATHAQTVTTNLVRSDGSTFQLADFDPTTGALLSQETFAGLFRQLDLGARAGLGPVWVRAGVSDVGQPGIPDDGGRRRELFRRPFARDDIPPWDFDAPGTQPVDTSAAAIAADGLVMLSTVAGTSALKTQYLQDAENILGVAQHAATLARRLASPCCSMASRAMVGRIPR